MQKKTRRFERTAASVCKEYAILTLATLVMSAGTYLFKFPNNFSFGGVTGLAVVLSAVSPLSAGTYNFIINMALLVLGFLFLGKGFGVKTVYISVLMSVALSVAEKLFPMSGPLTDQPVLELIFAIAIPGISSAIMFNMGASSGGTDIVAMILKKYTSMNIGTALLAVDLLIAVSACFVFDITTGLFSLCGLFTKTIVIDTAIENINLCKYFTIVCKDPTPYPHRTGAKCDAVYCGGNIQRTGGIYCTDRHETKPGCAAAKLYQKGTAPGVYDDYQQQRNYRKRIPQYHIK